VSPCSLSFEMLPTRERGARATRAMQGLYLYNLTFMALAEELVFNLVGKMGTGE